jgi:hypothetical protein
MSLSNRDSIRWTVRRAPRHSVGGLRRVTVHLARSGVAYHPPVPDCSCHAAPDPLDEQAAEVARRAAVLLEMSEDFRVEPLATLRVAAATEPFSTPFPTPEYPPPEWFDRPTWVASWRDEHGLGPERDPATGMLRLTVTDDGRVGGYFFENGQCIVHMQDACPGPSPTRYAAFHQQDVVCEGGKAMLCGVIGNVHGHASPYVDFQRAQAHYADPSSQMILCRAGDDERGGWIAGAVVPGLTYGDVALLRRSGLSGDWRPMPAAWWKAHSVTAASVRAAEGYDCIGPTLVTRPALPLVQKFTMGNRAAAILGGAAGIQLEGEEAALPRVATWPPPDRARIAYSEDQTRDDSGKFAFEGGGGRGEGKGDKDEGGDKKDREPGTITKKGVVVGDGKVVKVGDKVSVDIEVGQLGKFTQTTYGKAVAIDKVGGVGVEFKDGSRRYFEPEDVGTSKPAKDAPDEGEVVSFLVGDKELSGKDLENMFESFEEFGQAEPDTGKVSRDVISGKAASTRTAAERDYERDEIGRFGRGSGGTYVPKGRTDEESEDYTDDPRSLVMKFDREELVEAAEEARADGKAEALLKFDYEEWVPLQAVEEAIRMASMAWTAADREYERDWRGRFGRGDAGEGKPPEEPGSATGVDLAERFISGEDGLVLPVDEIATFTDKIAAFGEEAKAKGEGTRLNLCEVEVPGTNLFCGDNQGIPRQDMPQLKGPAVAGSPAEALVNERGEADITPGFVAELKNIGIGMADDRVRSDQLKSTQSELVGEKVAGIAGAISSGKLDVTQEPIIVSKDNYILDGHHRWAGQVLADADDGHLGDSSMPVIRVDMGILDLVEAANGYAHEQGIAQKGTKQGSIRTAAEREYERDEIGRFGRGSGGPSRESRPEPDAVVVRWRLTEDSAGRMQDAVRAVTGTGSNTPEEEAAGGELAAKVRTTFERGEAVPLTREELATVVDGASEIVGHFDYVEFHDPEYDDPLDPKEIAAFEKWSAFSLKMQDKLHEIDRASRGAALEGEAWAWFEEAVMAAPGNPDALREWFNEGADGQIDWGEHGAFDSCVAIASEHMDEEQAKGFCAERHNDAVGKYPGAKEGAVIAAANPAGLRTIAQDLAVRQNKLGIKPGPLMSALHSAAAFYDRDNAEKANAKIETALELAAELEERNKSVTGLVSRIEEAADMARTAASWDESKYRREAGRFAPKPRDEGESEGEAELGGATITGTDHRERVTLADVASTLYGSAPERNDADRAIVQSIDDALDIEGGHKGIRDVSLPRDATDYLLDGLDYVRAHPETLYDPSDKYDDTPGILDRLDAELGGTTEPFPGEDRSRALREAAAGDFDESRVKRDTSGRFSTQEEVNAVADVVEAQGTGIPGEAITEAIAEAEAGDGTGTLHIGDTAMTVSQPALEQMRGELEAADGGGGSSALPPVGEILFNANPAGHTDFYSAMPDAKPGDVEVLRNGEPMGADEVMYYDGSQEGRGAITVGHLSPHTDRELGAVSEYANETRKFPADREGATEAARWLAQEYVDRGGERRVVGEEERRQREDDLRAMFPKEMFGASATASVDSTTVTVTDWFNERGVKMGTRIQTPDGTRVEVDAATGAPAVRQPRQRSASARRRVRGAAPEPAVALEDADLMAEPEEEEGAPVTRAEFNDLLARVEACEAMLGEEVAVQVASILEMDAPLPQRS